MGTSEHTHTSDRKALCRRRMGSIFRLTVQNDAKIGGLHTSALVPGPSRSLWPCCSPLALGRDGGVHPWPDLWSPYTELYAHVMRETESTACLTDDHKNLINIREALKWPGTPQAPNKHCCVTARAILLKEKADRVICCPRL